MLTARLSISSLRRSGRIFPAAAWKGAARDSRGRGSLPKPDDRDSWDVLSLDVFDTISCRTWYSPRDIFAVFARALEPGASEGRWDEIAQCRHEVEKYLRSQRQGAEPALIEIHDALAQRLNRREANAQEAVELELAIERAAARPIRAVVEKREHARELGKKIVYLSDTYLNNDQLRQVLDASLLSDERVFTSYDALASKRGGMLFQHVAQSIPDARFLHVGDKRGADFIAPRAAGWQSEHYRGSQPSRYERRLAEMPWRQPLTGSAVAGAAKSARLANAHGTLRSQALATIGANVAGPLFTAFTAWCFEKAIERKADKVVFLARDGQVCSKIAPALIAKLPHEYLYASRQALYLPAIFAVGDEAWNWLESGLPGLTVSQALSRFGIDSAAVWRSLNDARLKPSTRLQSTACKALKQLLRTEFATPVLLRAARERALVRDYFRPHLKGCRRVAFVDIGWKGRLQICLEKIFEADKDLATVEIHGLFLSLTEASPLVGRSSHDFMVAYHLIRCPVLVEAIAVADHGTTVCYERVASGEVVAVLAPVMKLLDVDTSSMLRACFQFAADLCHNIDQARLDKRVILEELRWSAVTLLTDLSETPMLAEAEALGGFLHSDDAAHVKLSYVAPVLRFDQIVAVFFLGSRTRSRRFTYWRVGSYTRSFRNTMFVKVISLAAKGGRASKARARRLAKSISQ